MKPNSRLALITLISGALLLQIPSCGKDEPQPHEGIQTPTGPRDDGNNDDAPEQDIDNNDDNGGGNENGDPDKEVSPIVGKWKGNKSDIYFTFDNNLRFAGNLGNGDMAGRYEYLKRYESEAARLFLFIETQTEIKALELHCSIENNSMTLLDISGKKWVLTRKD